MSNQEIIERLEQLEEKRPDNSALAQIRAEVSQDKRKGRKDFDTKPPAWMDRRADAVRICREIIRSNTFEKAPIEFALSREFTRALEEDLGNKFDISIDPSGLKSALQDHWQIYEALPHIEAQVGHRNSLVHREFLSSLRERGFRPPSRPRGRPIKNARTNILIVLMLRVLDHIGWSPWHTHTDFKTTGPDIVVEALAEEIKLHLSTEAVAKAWKQYIAHRDKGLTYFGTPLKNRKLGAIYLCTHSK